jgi:hypothetical protein
VFRTSNTPLEAHPRYAAARGSQFRNANAARQAVAQQVSAANQVTEWQNERLSTALEQTTGQKHPTPQAWWSWWVHHNELHLDHKPVYSRHFYKHYSLAFSDVVPGQGPFKTGRVVGEAAPGTSPDRRSVHGNERRLGAPARHGCCFIPGTLVWTEAGLEPIEGLRPGDRVLSQDPDTGELSLKFIQETGVRPAAPTRRVQVGPHVVIATLGHPFWAAGKGWRMAKELAAVDRLHTLEGAVPIASLEDGPDWEAHNLVIEGFGTYFVGKAGLLVRDNNLGEVVTTPLPGYGTVAAGAPAR